MASIPYFSLGKYSFEKNSGYKSTVHALAELIDNAVEAEAHNINVILMVDRDNRLRKIAVADDGTGMSSTELQKAICEKSGSHLDRQLGSGSTAKCKFGKYGVGLPKASISQCSKFTVWSWEKGGPETAFRNGIDIDDEEWIKAGAEISDSIQEKAPSDWLKVASFEKIKSGTLVLWENLDGLTWARARWGDNSGLIPNLEFQVGRTYRKFLQGEKSGLKISVFVVDESFRPTERPVVIGPNDPLYLTKGCKIPRHPLSEGKQWPERDPLFDDLTGKDHSIPVKVPTPEGSKEVLITWRRSSAFKETFAKLGKQTAGSLPHGKHAMKNVGLSLLREGREVELSPALNDISEPRERWFGVEFDFPHELDAILGMTNNKQSYTRLDQVLKDGFKDFKNEDESYQQCIERMEREDPLVAVCLQIAWKVNEIWKDTKRSHMQMREDTIDEEPPSGGAPPEPTTQTPEEKAEEVASSADEEKGPPSPPPSEEEKEETREKVVADLISRNVPKTEAEQIAARIVDKGFTYAIINKRGLGSPFFNVGAIVDAKLIELNEDHSVHPYLLSTLEDKAAEDVDELRRRLEDARIAMFLMLEAWAKIETDVRGKDAQEHRKMQRVREDWGRSLETFVEKMQDSAKK